MCDSDVEISTLLSTDISSQCFSDYSDELLRSALSPVADMTLPGDLPPTFRSTVVDTVDTEATQYPSAANGLSIDERREQQSVEIPQNLPLSSDLLCTDLSSQADVHAHTELVKPVKTRVGKIVKSVTG